MYGFVVQFCLLFLFGALTFAGVSKHAVAEESSAIKRFEQSVLRKIDAKQPEELATYIHYNAMRDGLSGNSFLRIAEQLRTTNPDGLLLLKAGLDAALDKSQSAPGTFLGNRRFDVMTIVGLAPNQIELERLLCSDATVKIPRGDPLFVKVAMEDSGLLSDDDRQATAYPPRLEAHMVLAKYWALARCAEQTRQLFPQQSRIFLELANRYGARQSSGTLMARN